jgi:hypothetical protein
MKNLILLFLLTSSIFASSDAGFVIRNNDFSVTVRFNILEKDSPALEDMYLYESNMLLIIALNWYESNKNLLKKGNISLLFYQSKNIIYLGENGSLDNLGTISYSPSTIIDSFTSILNNAFNLRVSNDEFESIQLYLIESNEYIDAYSISDIYWGSIPGGYMYNFEKKLYRAFFWKSETAHRYLTNDDRKLTRIELTEDNITQYFPMLE